ncbi:MAG: hypothetical protein QF415_14880, partial [Candidatus Undinarchaeales archaeon]|nr:hypothetical protein [Candidatus Undinarchaeales archaeon]
MYDVQLEEGGSLYDVIFDAYEQIREAEGEPYKIIIKSGDVTVEAYSEHFDKGLIESCNLSSHIEQDEDHVPYKMVEDALQRFADDGNYLSVRAGVKPLGINRVFEVSSSGRGLPFSLSSKDIRYNEGTREDGKVLMEGIRGTLGIRDEDRPRNIQWSKQMDASTVTQAYREICEEDLDPNIFKAKGDICEYHGLSDYVVITRDNVSIEVNDYVRMFGLLGGVDRER